MPSCLSQSLFCGALQVTVGYKEATAASMGLSTEEAGVEASSQFQVTASPGRALHLDLPHVKQRKCFKAGTDAQRIIIPAARLSIVDE